MTSPVLHFKDSPWHLGGEGTKVAEEDSSANGKLYLESFVAAQARRDAGWDWRVAWEKWWDSKYIEDRVIGKRDDG